MVRLMLLLVLGCLLSSVSAVAQQEIPVEVVTLTPVDATTKWERPHLTPPLKLKNTYAVKVTMILSAFAIVLGTVGAVLVADKADRTNDFRGFLAASGTASLGIWTLVISGLMLAIRRKKNRKRMKSMGESEYVQGRVGFSF